MQENNMASIANSPQTTEVQPLTVDSRPKASNFLVILLSILLLLSVLIAGFFAYQTQKLVKELTILRTEPAPVATVEPTTEPVATDSSAVDPTAKWKTYIGSNFSFNYPNDLVVNKTINGVVEFKKDNNVEFIFNGISTLTDSEFLEYVFIAPETVLSKNNDTWKTDLVLAETLNYIGITKNQNKNYLVGFQSKIGDQEIRFRSFADQILSTFKFTN